MALVEAFQPPPGRADRQLEGLGEGGDALDRPGGPAAAAQQQEGMARGVQRGAQAFEVRRAGMVRHALVARHVRDGGRAPQRVFGQRQHHRAGPAAGGGGVGAGDELGDAVAAVDLGDPLGHGAEHAAVVDFLEGLALHEVVADLAHEQDHGRGILEGRVHADAGVGGARTARDEADARLAGELAVGLGHVGGAAFLAAYDGFDGARVFVQRVDAGQIAFARDQEHAPRAVDAQLLHQYLAAIARDRRYYRHAGTPGVGAGGADGFRSDRRGVRPSAVARKGQRSGRMLPSSSPKSSRRRARMPIRCT